MREARQKLGLHANELRGFRDTIPQPAPATLAVEQTDWLSDAVKRREPGIKTVGRVLEHDLD